MDFNGDSGCTRWVANTWDPYAYGNRYTNSYRHRYSCTHPNTFTDPDGNRDRDGYSSTNGYRCTNGYSDVHSSTHTDADLNSYFYVSTNDDANANAW